MSIEISPYLKLPESDIEMSAVRSQGAGGQNVNKVATAIQLRFDIPNSSLPEDIKHRLLQVKDRRLSREGIWVIKSQQFRTQARNHSAALERLCEFILSAAVVPKKRIPTTVKASVRRRRLENKKRRGLLKSSRQRVDSL